MQGFDHITTWVFDLDHTLYPPGMCLFGQINDRMNAWIMAELGVSQEKASDLRDHYYRTYGTTLAGLMREHGVTPAAYLHSVHNIDFSVLDPAPRLAAAIAALPGRKIVFTNGPVGYADAVLKARGLTRLWDAVYGTEDTEFIPKPEHAAFEKVFTKDGLEPTRAAMFEDSAANLEVPQAMGLSTVHVAETPTPAPHIHHHTDDLEDFLGRVLVWLGRA